MKRRDRAIILTNDEICYLVGLLAHDKVNGHSFNSNTTHKTEAERERFNKTQCELYEAINSIYKLNNTPKIKPFKG